MVIKKINITKDMRSAAKSVFECMAWVEVVKPIVLKYECDILAKHQFKEKRSKEIITDPKHTYLMSDEDFKVYLDEVEEARIKAGLKIKSPGNCPLLEAENNLRIAERAFSETLIPITKISIDDVLCSKNGLENYAKYIDLSLKLVASAV